ncbi:Fur family transcriptional regulator [Tepidicaulis sp. LMO-SS28]|uniref:Fur family transcriptional regulator n=1 Tax=Tepidicaulis sp. LMO-SS28 TaxID=3447455 RepID=UPI003EDEE8B0
MAPKNAAQKADLAEAFAPHDHSLCVDDALARAREACEAAGVRLTPIREEVLRIVWDSHKPIGAYDVLARLAEKHGNPKPPTVYRALDFLLEQGLVHRIESLNAYIGCSHENGDEHSSQFLICRECGNAKEISDPAIGAALKKAAAAEGFKAEKRVIEVTGLCHDCAGTAQ